jgi:hypothetical protein
MNEYAATIHYDCRWETLVNQINDGRRGAIPKSIHFCVQGANGQPLWRRKETRNATLDELANAVVTLSKEIERLLEVKAGLIEIQKRAHDVVRPGSTTIHAALFSNAPTDNDNGA